MTVIRQRNVQFGDESTWGTAVAPTVEFPGVRTISMPPSLVTEISDDIARSALGPGRYIVEPRHESRGVSLDGQMIYEFEMYLLDGADEATPAGGGPYTYTYTFPTTTAATPRIQTMVTGADDGVWGLTSAVLETYSLSWTWGEIIERSATFLGYAVENDTLAVLTEPTDASVTEALGGCHVNVYIDATGGSYGGTAMGKAMSGTFKLDLLRDYLTYTGTCYPSGVFDSDGWRASGTLSLQQDATSAAFADAIVGATTRRKLRIDITNGGAAAAERSMEIDLFVELKIEELHTDNNGLVTTDLSYRSIQDENDSDFYGEIVLTNNTATAY